MSSQAQPRWGIVKSVDPSRPAVRVSLQPEGVLTGWLPVLQQAAGGGMTSLTVPDVGWQACVIADLGHAEHGIVVGFAHSNAQPPPGLPNAIGGGAAPMAPGETVLTGPGGAVFLRLGAGGAMLRGNLQIDGNLLVNGDITDLNGAHGSLSQVREAYRGHEHSDPQGGTVGVPNHSVP